MNEIIVKNMQLLVGDLSLFLVFLRCFNCVQGFDSEVENDISTFIEEIRECRHVPAVSLAVVTRPEQSGNLVQAYGQADVEDDIPAESSTAFALGSVTKSFTVTLLANLLTEYKGKYSWDTPVKDILGEGFRFGDEDRTNKATLRDLAAHKMGFFTYVLPAIAGLDESHTTMEYCRRLRYIKPYPSASGGQTEMRTQFIYSNIMYMLLGCVAEKLGNDSYSNLLYSRVLEPLKMTSTVLANDVTNWTSPRVAHPYVYYQGNLTRLGDDVASGISPMDAAGALFSTASDMSLWLQFNLGFLNVSLADQGLLQQIYLPQFTMNSGVKFFRPTFPFSDEVNSYNMGWMTGSYRGFRYIEHGGLLSGFGSQLRIYPDKKLGIFVDTNGPMYTDAYYARATTMWYISDKLLGLDNQINTTLACDFPSPFISQNALFGLNSSLEPSVQEKLPIPENQLRRCLGVFGNPLFGNVTIARSQANSSFLELSFGRLVRAELWATPKADPKHPDLLGGTLQKELWYFLETGPKPFSQLGVLLFVLFYEDQNESFHKLSMRLPINALEAPLTFTRGLTWAEKEHDIVPSKPKCPDSTGASRTFTLNWSLILLGLGLHSYFLSNIF